MSRVESSVRAPCPPGFILLGGFSGALLAGGGFAVLGGEGGAVLGVPVGSSFQRCGGTDGLCPKLRAQCAGGSPSKVYPAGKLQ